MDQHQGVKVVEACQVAPLQGSITSSTTPTSLPLTYFDLLSLEFKPVRQLFFYEFPHPTTSFFDSVVPNLKHSLQLTLQHFLPLAGTLTWPHDSPYPVINYVPGDVVPFIVAESVANNFNTLCSNLCETVARHPLIPHLSIISHEKVSLLALQVTLFPNNGFCIGITIGHGAADGNSAALFINAWAYICSKLIDSTSPSSPLSLSLPEHLTPFFDRSVITDRTTIIPEAGGPKNRSVKRWEWKNHATQVDTFKGLFELTPWHVQNLKQYARSKLKTKLRISTFSVPIEPSDSDQLFRKLRWRPCDCGRDKELIRK
ncbi:hypothetical protein RIF29_13952 [Crotalaria pallida]|uniref:Uncharacterized protein n=1 Tax=Crotalaria pallida TaxID=3830 RepID=A0AAN9FG02_CROPI